MKFNLLQTFFTFSSAKLFTPQKFVKTKRSLGNGKCAYSDAPILRKFDVNSTFF
jgi:hypothetical protein